MKTQILEPQKEVKQKIQLVRGTFSAPEASDVINGLIKEKINFHKIQRLRLLEGDHICNTGTLDGRIEELLEEKDIARDFLSEMRAKGGKLHISGVLEISVIK